MIGLGKKKKKAKEEQKQPEKTQVIETNTEEQTPEDMIDMSMSRGDLIGLKNALEESENLKSYMKSIRGEKEYVLYSQVIALLENAETTQNDQ